VQYADCTALKPSQRVNAARRSSDEGLHSRPALRGQVMQTQALETMMQGLVILGGLTFSLAASLLIEELIFGRIVRVAFQRKPEKKHLAR
jgi:hypothetical protein